MSESEAWAIASQQSHALGKSPKGWGTAEGKHTAKEKYDTPKDDKKMANPGNLESAKIAAMVDELYKIAFFMPSTQGAAQQAGRTFRTLVNAPTRQALAGRAALGTAATQHGLTNLPATMKVFQEHYPDVLNAMKQHPMGQHMSPESMVQTFMMSHEGGSIRDTAGRLGILPKITAGKTPVISAVRGAAATAPGRLGPAAQQSIPTNIPQMVGAA